MDTHAPWKRRPQFAESELDEDAPMADPALTRRILRDLQRLMAQEESRRPVGEGPEVDREPDAETLDRLRALGYLE